MKYTALDESRVANIARGEASAILFVTRLSAIAIYLPSVYTLPLLWLRALKLHLITALFSPVLGKPSPV